MLVIKTGSHLRREHKHKRKYKHKHKKEHVWTEATQELTQA